METNSASAILKSVCPVEWADIVDVLTHYRLDPSTWLRKGGNRGAIPEEIDRRFHDRGWIEARLDLETRGLILDRDGRRRRELAPVLQEGYLVDNFKGRVVLDVEWAAKDGNLDRDLAAYRAWHEAGLISAAVVITRNRLELLQLARELWGAYQKGLPMSERSGKLPVDLTTSTTTTFDKAALRVKRGVMGTCPILIIGANRATWNGQPFREPPGPYSAATEEL
ncbi:restriction endonuclease [Roseovarius spongiae]|uniref:Restriction endonuclease n=2 Tax=Roseovarius spongiae TaxID=2320272 RepID=A0A3A8AXT1_9RHOB|nr:restriction endonuclease [Roseovarius spongiae]